MYVGTDDKGRSYRSRRFLASHTSRRWNGFATLAMEGESLVFGVRTYLQEYVESCRTKVKSDVATFRNLKGSAVRSKIGDTSVIRELETVFFNTMVLVLDACFVHRLRTVEGKDGNPLNEVRVLCNSMLNNGNTVVADSSIKLSPAKSILKLQTGDEIRLNEEQFAVLSDAFFSEIESRFT